MKKGNGSLEGWLAVGVATLILAPVGLPAYIFGCGREEDELLSFFEYTWRFVLAGALFFLSIAAFCSCYQLGDARGVVDLWGVLWLGTFLLAVLDICCKEEKEQRELKLLPVPTVSRIARTT